MKVNFNPKYVTLSCAGFDKVAVRLLVMLVFKEPGQQFLATGRYHTRSFVLYKLTTKVTN